MLDARCWSKIPSLAGIKTLPFTVPGNIINLLYGPFRKIKRDKILYFIPAKDGISASLQQVSRNQYPVSLHYLHHNILKLGSKFKILAYIDGYIRCVLDTGNLSSYSVLVDSLLFRPVTPILMNVHYE